MSAGFLWPADAVAGAPTNPGRKLRQTSNGVFLSGATSARPLGARSGVRPGTPSTTVSATSTVWTVQPHAGALDVEIAVEAGPYSYAFDTVQTGAVTAANVSNPRIDLVWVRLDDPAEGDGTAAPQVVCGYTAGIPGTPNTVVGSAGGPPALPARCMGLGQLAVPVSGGGAPVVTWIAPILNAPGGIHTCRSSSEYPSPYPGCFVYDQALDLLLYSPDGSALRRYEPPRVGAQASFAGDAWSTDGAVINLGNTGGAWTSRKDSGGFVTAGGTSTPITIPAGQDGEYDITLQGVTTVAATGLSRAWIQLGGTALPAGMPSSFRSSDANGETNWSVTASGIPLLGGNTVGGQLAWTAGAAKSVSGWLTITRTGR